MLSLYGKTSFHPPGGAATNSAQGVMTPAQAAAALSGMERLCQNFLPHARDNNVASIAVSSSALHHAISPVDDPAAAPSMPSFSPA